MPSTRLYRTEAISQSQRAQGTGAPGVASDVLVKDGRISEIGSGLSGDRELDARGAVVAPEEDAQITLDRVDGHDIQRIVPVEVSRSDSGGSPTDMKTARRVERRVSSIEQERDAGNAVRRDGDVRSAVRIEVLRYHLTVVFCKEAGGVELEVPHSVIP